MEAVQLPAFIGKQVIVIRAGISGLRAARALADHFEQVIVLERDNLPNGPIPRAGLDLLVERPRPGWLTQGDGSHDERRAASHH
jgi:hypothetical protein